MVTQQLTPKIVSQGSLIVGILTNRGLGGQANSKLPFITFFEGFIKFVMGNSFQFSFNLSFSPKKDLQSFDLA